MRIAALIAATLLAAPLCAATPQDYGWAWPLTTPGDSGAWQIELTPPVYAALDDPALRDIEVFNAAGEAVPLALVAFDQREVLHDEQLALPLFALPQSASGTEENLHLHLQRGEHGQLRRLDVDSAPITAAPLASYVLDASAARGDLDSLWLQWGDAAGEVNAQFAVDVGNDLEHWHTVVASASVIDLHQGDARLTRRHIPLPGTRVNYLRLRRLDPGPALPELAVQARLRTREAATVPARQWIAASFEREETRAVANAAGENAPVAYLYRLPAALAVEAARIALDSDNSLARVSLLSRHSAANAAPNAAPPPWTLRSELTTFRLRQDELRIDNDELILSAGDRADEWRIETRQPLDRAPTLTLAWRPDRLVFLARGAGPYRLAAGSRTARHADYPVDAALAQYRARLGAEWQPPRAMLGERTTLAGAAALRAPPPAQPWKTWLLWGVLIAGAALVIGLALQLLRDAKPQ